MYNLEINKRKKQDIHSQREKLKNSEFDMNISLEDYIPDVSDIGKYKLEWKEDDRKYLKQNNLG